MLADTQWEKVRAKLDEMEATVVADPKRGNVTIGALAEEDNRLATTLLEANDPIMPVLRTALVINWPEAAMASRYVAFRESFPHIATLASLKREMTATEPVPFCKTYLNIDASSENNPKYQLLLQLVDGFLAYQSTIGAASEMVAIRHWAERVDVNALANDPIGRRRGVGIGVVENIRRNLGMSVIKPDRHVIGVVRKCLQLDIPVAGFGSLAESLGLEPRYLDFVLFKYGQVQGISA